MKKSISNETLHKEIELIQSCIERMSKNSFSCKGWNLTLIAGVFALTSEDINQWYICIIILCIDLCFWWLDSYYLLQEQKYRDKYEWVISKRIAGCKKYLYDLDPDNKKTILRLKNRTHLKAAFSTTIAPIYVGIIILVIAFILIKIHGGI